jgi:hypothetical protein
MKKETMIISLDAVNKYVGILFDDPAETREDHPGIHEGGMYKTTFFEYYYEDEANEIDSIFYEPRNDVYFIQFKDGLVQQYDKPKDHPALEAIDDMAEAILDDELIIKNNLYPGISHRNAGGWLECLQQLSLLEDKVKPKYRYKKVSDLPSSLWKAGSITRQILDSYGITEDMKGYI